VEARSLTSHTLIAGDPGRPAVLLLHGAGPGANAAANWRHLTQSDLGTERKPNTRQDLLTPPTP
jgi:hypothetical protein